jgi:hypothetical protein
MKTSIFSPFNTSGQAGGSLLLDRILDKLKGALDVLANGQIGNVVEEGGVWTVAPGSGVPNGNPPPGKWFVYLDPADGKWKSRGALGTVTVWGSP